MEDATSGRSSKTASEDIIATCAILYEVAASIKDAKRKEKMAVSRLSFDARALVRFQVGPLRFLADRVTLNRLFSSWYFCFSLSVLFHQHQCSTLISIYTLLLPGGKRSET
jgi:hypothetical protein